MTEYDATEIAYRNGYEAGCRTCETEIVQLSEKCQRLEKERDAAVEQMRGNCKYCKNNFESAKYCISNCDENLSAWEWVGIDETD